MPGDVFLGPQRAHSGPEYELVRGRIRAQFACGTLGELSCGRLGAHLSCIHSTEAFRGCGMSRKDARGAMEEEIGAAYARRETRESKKRVEEVKRVERVEGTE